MVNAKLPGVLRCEASGCAARTRIAAVALVALAWGAGVAQAQGDRPIKFILPVATASGVDTIVRAAAPALAKTLGGPVVIENQPGAGGIIGTSALVKSPPDGFTLSVVSNNHVIFPSVYKTLPFDPLADITPIAVIGSTPMVLVVNPKVPAKNAQELIALLKAKPDALQLRDPRATARSCTSRPRCFSSRPASRRSTSPTRASGRCLPTFWADRSNSARSRCRRSSSTSRAARCARSASAPRCGFPRRPTFRRWPSRECRTTRSKGWFAVIGPARLPPAEVKRINAAFAAAFATPEVRDAMAKQGNTINVDTPEQAGPFFRSELAKYAAIVKAIGLEPQ